MSGKQVIITIRGIQVDETGEENSIEFVTPGQFIFKNEAFYVIYEDSKLTGMEGTKTSLKVQPDKVILNRMGATNHRQVYEKGILNESYYVTTNTRMLMGVIPSVVDVNLTYEGGSINLEYELEVGREKISNNRLLITIEEV